MCVIVQPAHVKRNLKYLQQVWTRREISNFEYLMRLNRYVCVSRSTGMFPHSITAIVLASPGVCVCVLDVCAVDVGTTPTLPGLLVGRTTT